jgi:thymidylate synthase
MNKLDKAYTDLLQDILDNGVTKGDRTGTGTISVFGRQIRHQMSEGFPLLTTKKMPFKTIVTELLWFLRGDTNIKYLVDNNCHIWDGDAYKRFYNETQKGLDSMFLKNEGPNKIVPFTQEEFVNKIKTDDEFAKKWGELGPIYGAQWRSWNGVNYLNRESRNMSTPKIDQIANLINDLKTNPDSRRLMVNAWNVGELDSMVLPPCHYGFQVYTRELSDEERLDWMRSNKSKVILPMRDPNIEFSMDEWFRPYGVPKRAISLMWNQRSVDTFLGLPFNIASYGLLLEIIAKEVNMVPDELIGNLGDVHLYSNHIEQAKEQIGRELTHDEQIAIYSELGLTESQESRTNRFIGKEKFEPNIPKQTREPFPLPTLNINTEFWKTQSGECGVGPLDTNLEGFEISDFQIENYQAHPTIKAPLSN